MRQLNNNEMLAVSGGMSDNGYNFSYVVGNIGTGIILGFFFPGVPAVLGATALIASPPLALGAVFGTYALARVGANALDNAFLSPSCGEHQFVAV